MSDWLKMLISQALGMITAFVATYFTAMWAIRRGFQERRCERKERAYAEIVEALYESIRYCELAADEHRRVTERSHPKKEEFAQTYMEAHWKLHKATDIGAFVISPKAVAILMDLRKRPRPDWKTNPPWEVYEDESKGYKDAIQKIRECAEQDLRDHGFHWLSFWRS